MEVKGAFPVEEQANWDEAEQQNRYDEASG